MLEIHGKKDCPFAWRVRLTARQKEVEFAWLPYDVPDPDPRTMEHNPERKSPLLWEDGFSLAESVVVAQYLDESREGRRLMPANTRDRARARLLLATVVAKLEVAPSHAESRDAAVEKARRGHAALDRVLSDGRAYLGGDSPSLPDLMLWPFLALQEWDGVPPQPARAAEYWRRVKDTPALVATRP
jgi:glutathione S-transferase